MLLRINPTPLVARAFRGITHTLCENRVVRPSFMSICHGLGLRGPRCDRLLILDGSICLVVFSLDEYVAHTFIHCTGSLTYIHAQALRCPMYMPFRTLKSFFSTADELMAADLPQLGEMTCGRQNPLHAWNQKCSAKRLVMAGPLAPAVAPNSS